MWCALRLVCGVIMTAMISSMAIAQEPVSLSLDQMVTLFHVHNPDLKFRLQETARLKGVANTFKAFPNPALSVYREDLGGPSYNETIVTLRQSIDIYGQPALRSRVAADEIAAADLQFRHDELVLLNALKSEYISLVFLQYKRATQHLTLEAFQQTYAMAQTRQTEGEISGFELQRFALELAVYEQTALKTDIAFESRVMALLDALGGPTAFGLEDVSFLALNVQLSDSLTFSPLDLSREDAERLALESRHNLQAAERLLDATRRRQTITRRNRLPKLTFEAGYKRQNDGAQGVITGASLSLPLFNKNGGPIQAAQARHLQQETIVARLYTEIRRKVHTSYYASMALAERWKILQTRPLSPSMRDVAWLSYSEGEITLIEWLDAVRASSEATLLSASILADYQRSLIDLDTAMGGALFQNKDIGQ